jgi:Protein of unknown function (DUF1622)
MLCQETHHLTFDFLGKVAAVASIRTALAFFLAREIAELHHEAGAEGGQEKEGKDGGKGHSSKKRSSGAAHSKEE